MGHIVWENKVTGWALVEETRGSGLHLCRMEELTDKAVVGYQMWRNGKWVPYVAAKAGNDGLDSEAYVSGWHNPSTMDGRDPESGKLGEITIASDKYKFSRIPLQSDSPEEVDRKRGGYELEYALARQRYFDIKMGRTTKDSSPENRELSQTEILAGTDADGVYRMPGQDEDGMINGRFL